MRRRSSPASSPDRFLRSASFTADKPSGDRPRGHLWIHPVGIAVCALATLIALPILIFGDYSGAQQVQTTGTTAVPAVTVSVDSLLEVVEPDSLFDAGAKDEDPMLDDDRAALERAAPTAAPASSAAPTTTGSPEVGAEADSSTPAAERTATVKETPVATTTPPTTAAPTTAAPTTAAPTTAAPTTAPPTTAAPTTAAPTTAAPTTAAPAPASGEPSANQWAVLRQCESGGSFTIVSRNGLYHGAYQFHPDTWDSIARSIGRGDLVGLLPSQAAPEAQDVLALALWRQSGWSPWPSCGRKAAAAT